MAAGKRAKSGGATQPLERLQSRMQSLQRDAEKVLADSRKRATKMTQEQRRSMERLIDQAQKVRSDVEKRAQKAGKDIENRAEKLWARLEKELGRQMSTVLKRLDIPTRREVQTLSRRIAGLEKKLSGGGRARKSGKGSR